MSPGRASIMAHATIAWSLAVAAVAGAEAATHRELSGALMIALGGAVGALLGGAIGVVQLALGPLPSWARWLAWGGAGLAAGLGLAARLGAFAKLSGPHHGLALATIAVGSVSGAILGLCLALVQPSEEAPLRAPGRRWVRAALAMMALLVVIVAEVADDVLLVLRSYPPARAALVVAAWLVVGVTIAVALPPYEGGGRPAARARRWLAFAWVAVVALGVALSADLSSRQIAPLLIRPTAAHLLAFARDVSDVDRDGSSSWFGGGDCAPWDPRVHPRAAEIPGNGIDDNCSWGDARSHRPAPVVAPVPTTQSPVNVLLITIDCLRPDHVGAYGYSRPTTPNIDRFAAGAVRYDRAYTAGGWTSLALHSMMAGVYPRRLTWEPFLVTSARRIVPFPWQGRLDPGEEYLSTMSAPVERPFPPLPWWLSRRGMRTGAVVASSPSKVFRFRGWLDRTFERTAVPDVDRDDLVSDRAIEMVRGFADAPFFLWVHYFEPHDPYVPHAGLPTFGSDVTDLYDHDIAFTDQQVGRLLGVVDELHARPTAVLIGADHGEAFIGGYSTHGTDLHEDAIRIPLLARGPGTRSGAVDSPVSLIDVFPTVLEWTGTPGPSGTDGVSLLHPRPDRIPLSDIWRRDRNDRIYIDLVGAAGKTRRLVHDNVAEVSTLLRVGDRARRPESLDEPEPPELTAAVWTYLEESGGLPETTPH